MGLDYLPTLRLRSFEDCLLFKASSSYARFYKTVRNRIRCFIVRHRRYSPSARHQWRLASCHLLFTIYEPNRTKLSGLRSRTHGNYSRTLRMVMLYIWIKFYDDCVDRSSQSHIFYAPSETYKMTS